jgi:hypothetical protein
MHDSYLGPGKIKALKMLDLQKKYAIISYILQVQHQARNIASRPKLPVSIYWGVIKIEGSCKLSLQTSYT